VRTIEEKGDVGKEGERVLEEVVNVAKLLAPRRDALSVLGRVGRRLAKACVMHDRG